MRPGTLSLSIAVGFAAGALLGAFAFEMLPRAAEVASQAPGSAAISQRRSI